MASPQKACATWITHGRTRRGRDSYTPRTRIDTPTRFTTDIEAPALLRVEALLANNYRMGLSHV